MPRAPASSYSRWRQVAQAVCTVLVASCGLAAAAPAAAQTSRVTVQATAKAIVVAQLSFFKVDDINFGKIIAGTTAGTVTVAPTGARTATGGARLASDSTVRAARFAGKGSANQNVGILVTSNTSTVTRIGGTEKMTFDTFVIGSSPTATLSTTPTTFRISSSTGIFTFPIGATLRVNANQVPGNYAGSFTVTLEYQ